MDGKKNYLWLHELRGWAGLMKSQPSVSRRKCRQSFASEQLEYRLQLSNAQLLCDINTLPVADSSDPTSFTVMGDFMYFSARTSTHGLSLWRTDGTTEGTTIVKRLLYWDEPSGNRNAYGLVNVSGVLYFTSHTENGPSLWRSDGTEAGTLVLKSFTEIPSYLTNVGGTLYFSAQEQYDNELWKSDGSSEGTILVRNVRQTGSSFPRNLMNVNGSLFFIAVGNSGETGLWMSDGTEMGTHLVSPVDARFHWFNPSQKPVVVGSEVFFTGHQQSTGYELWKTDGTAAGTLLVKDIRLGSSSSKPYRLTEWNGGVVLTAEDGIHGRELWFSDGSTGGTHLVRDINPSSVAYSVGEMLNINGILYFNGDDGVSGQELWTSDGTEAGTQLFADLEPRGHHSSPSDFERAGNQLFFRARTSGTPHALWSLNVNTRQLTDLRERAFPGTNSTWGNLTNFNGMLYFRQLSSTTGIEMWRSDGTVVGTVLVRDIRSGTQDTRIDNLTNVNGTVYFSANDGVHGSELWSSDGTAVGTVMMGDLVPGAESSYPYSMVTADGRLFFGAGTNENSHGLWTSNGVPGGTILVADNASGPKEVVGNWVYYLRHDTEYGTDELWRTDSSLVETLVAISQPITTFANVAGTLYYGTRNGELWKLDSLTNQPILVKLVDVWNSRDISSIVAVNGMMYFLVSDWDGGYDLWKSDGTEIGTSRVRDFPRGTGSSTVGMLKPGPNELYFLAIDSNSRTQVWKSDGTSAGTVQLSSFGSGEGFGLSIHRSSPVVFHERLYFAARDAAFGQELWCVNATNTGVERVADIAPGGRGSDPGVLTVANDRLYFAANDGVNGRELWTTDGTSEGTYLLADITADAGSSWPMGIVFASPNLFVSAANESFGRELFSVEVNVSPDEINMTSSFIDEGEVAERIVGGLSARDQNLSDTHKYEFVNGTGSDDNFLFRIVGHYVVTSRPLDYERASHHTIRVRATDSGGRWKEQVFDIFVRDVNPDPALIITPSAGYTAAAEAGVVDSFSVRLTVEPLGPVVIRLKSRVSSQALISPDSLIFSPANWNVPQEVTVSAVDDNTRDGDVSVTIEISPDPLSAGTYREIPTTFLEVLAIDNEVPEILTHQTNGETIVSEDGLTDTLDVRLAVQPANDVYVTVVSLVNPTVQVSSSELHFTPANWNVSQTIIVSAFGESLTTSTILELRVDSRSGPYQTAAAVQTNVRVLDDESAYPVFSNVNDPVIAIEGGQAASMSVRLSVAPVGPVQLKVLAVKPDELNVQDGVLQFDATNWNQPQTVTIIAVDEEIADGDRYEYVRFVWGPNLSAPYLRQSDFSVGLQTVDNEIAAIEVVETDGSTVVTESGSTDSFGVRLSSRPNGPIDLTVTSRDLTAVTVSPLTLRFTPENWNMLQTVTVTAADDVLADGNQLASIRLAVNLAFSSGGYDHAPFVDVNTTTLDNELATLIVQETNGTTIVSESGTTDVVQVRLSAVPTSTVTVLVSVDDASEVGASVSSLTFSASNWNVPQSVSLTGLDDAIVDGPVLSQLRFAFAAASPGAYASALPMSVAVTTSDNEIAGLVIIESGGSTLVSEAGSSDTVTVRLTARPVQNVILMIQSLDTTEFTVSPMTLTFTPANWNVPQTVMVVGVDDSLVDGIQTSALRISVDSLSQVQFQGITTNVLVKTSDDELAVPSIVAPVSLISSQRPTIIWNPVARAASYRVIVVNRTTGGTVIADTVVASSKLPIATDLGIGAFAVRVQAISITGRTSAWSSERTFRVDTAPTMSPMPLYVNSPKPTFKWSSLAGAVYYDLQVDSILDIRPQIIRRTTLTGTSFVAPANLRLGLYVVKIRAIDAGGVPAKWSVLTSFYLVTAPTPLSPPSATFSVRPKFSWKSVDGAIAYDLKYQKNSTGQITEVNGLRSTTFVPSADLVSGAYRWWVRTRGMYDVVGAWSAVQGFTIGGSPTLTPIASTSGRNPRFEWSRVEGAVRYFLRVDRIDVPQSYYIRQESLTATVYTVPVSLKPGLYRAWIKAISASGQVTSWSQSIDITVVKAEEDRKTSGGQSRNRSSFLPSDLLIPEFGPDMPPVFSAAPADLTVVQSANDVSRILMSVDLPGARDVDLIFGLNQEILAETDVLQKVTQAVFETTDWYSQL